MIYSVPALNRYMSSEPPTATMTPAATKLISARGALMSAPSTSSAPDRTPSPSSARTSAPTSTATAKAPPTTGTASASLYNDSIANSATTTGQFASVTSAPRVSAARSGSAAAIGE